MYIGLQMFSTFTKSKQTKETESNVNDHAIIVLEPPDLSTAWRGSVLQKWLKILKIFHTNDFAI